MGKEKNPRSGFTRADLLVLVGSICFLAVVWIGPSLAGSAARSDEAVCANNLRHIGQGFSQWAQDHEDSYAWWLPANSAAATKSTPWHASLWFQYFWVSNELHSPRYLADPADDFVHSRVATNWGDQPGGLVNPNWRNSAISYFLGLHGTPLQPHSILAGDGNVQGGSIVGCSTGINGTDMRREAMWPGTVHGDRGNLLFSDGRVEMTDTGRLREAVFWNPDYSPDDLGNWNMHFLKPRLP
jgi:prepilin-type processing-associated H-X9-DG protein